MPDPINPTAPTATPPTVAPTAPVAPVPPTVTPTPPADPLNTDIKKLIEKTRQEEKKKLYDELERARETAGENRALREQITQLQTQLKEVGTTPSTVPPTPSGTPSPVDPVKLAAEITQKVRAEFEAQTAPIVRQVQELQQENRALKLDGFRRAKLAEAGPEIIAAMVTGNTEQEIETSIVVAKQEFARIKQSIAPAATATPPTTPTAPTTPAPTPVAPASPTVIPGTSNPDGTTPELENVRTMSPKEYAANREKILAGVKKVALPQNVMTR